MSYIANKPESYEGKVVGNGQCVAYVRECSGAPVSSTWTKGDLVKTADVKQDTAIATFDDTGHYPSNPTGQHAAIFISKDSQGIWVWDQWAGQTVHKRFIRYKGFQGSWSNDADRFSVIEGSRLLEDLLISAIDSEEPICVELANLAAYYGDFALRIVTPSYLAEARPLDEFGRPITTFCDTLEPRRGEVYRGLGRFKELRLSIKPWASTVVEVQLRLMSLAGDQAHCKVLDVDGVVLSDQTYATPSGTVSAITARSIGISEIVLSHNPELTLLSLCVRTLP